MEIILKYPANRFAFVLKKKKESTYEYMINLTDDEASPKLLIKLKLSSQEKHL